MWRQNLKCSLSNIFLQKNSKDLCLKSKHVGACHLMTAKNSVFIIYQGSSVSKKSTILNISLNMLCEFWGLVFFFFFFFFGQANLSSKKSLVIEEPAVWKAEKGSPWSRTDPAWSSFQAPLLPRAAPELTRQDWHQLLVPKLCSRK